jgi:adenylate cyclase
MSGTEDGSFLEMDFIDRAKPGFRASLNVDEDAVFRLVVISRTGKATAAAVTQYLSENLIQVAEVPGPTSYDPRRRPWYVDAFKDEKTLLTGPVHFLRHRRARLHVPHPTEGRPPRRRRRRPPAQPAGAIAG